MGVNFQICNLAKREYFEMWTFGEDSRYPSSTCFNTRQCLHTHAITYLCTSGPGSGDYHSRWYGDPIDIIADLDPRSELIEPTCTDISLPLLDSLCDGEEAFFDEILQRGLQDYRWDVPVTTALLTLIDDARYTHFRNAGMWNLHEKFATAGEHLPRGEDRWTKAIHSLREHYAQSYQRLGMEPPTDRWDRTCPNPAANPYRDSFES